MPIWLFMGVLTAQAQLAVAVFPLKIIGQKAIVPLTMTNHFAESVESARAVCFLLDEQATWLANPLNRSSAAQKTG